jgi:putative DNA primase/helicase
MSGTGMDRQQPLTHSGLLQVDFDHLDEDFNSKRALVQRDPHIAFGYVSPSGVGLKLGLRIDPERHAQSFAAAKAYFLKRYGIEIDPQVSDRLRLCFVSDDPDLWLNPHAVPLPLPEDSGAEPPPPAANTTKNAAVTSSSPKPATKEIGATPSDLELKAALSRLPCDDYATWLKVGMALKSWDPVQGLELWEHWSRPSPKYEPGVCARKWETFSGASGGGQTVTVRSVLALAQEADDLLVSRLARLDLATYERVRDKEAKRAGLRTSVLDMLVQARRTSDDPVKRHGPLGPDPEPWPEPVDGAQLLDTIVHTVNRFLIVPDTVPETIALWVLHTYLTGEMAYSPILALISPTKRCGKSVALELLVKLARRPLLTSNATPAALYRAIEAWRPSLLIDEFDSHSQDEAQVELRNILNSGFHKSGIVLRCEGEDNRPTPFTTFCPKVVASIGDLPDTAMDRSIVVRMRRKLKTEATGRVRKFDCPELRQQCVRWALDHQSRFQEIDPALPESLNDRQQDIWEPLFVLATLAGGPWPETVRKAALALTGEASEETIGVTLLKDIRSVFAGSTLDRISTSDLLEKLNSLEDRPWATFVRGQPLSAHRLGRLLKPYGIVSGTVRIGNQTPKGYTRESFQEAWDRYVDGENPSEAVFQSATPPQLL